MLGAPLGERVRNYRETHTDLTEDLSVTFGTLLETLDACRADLESLDGRVSLDLDPVSDAEIDAWALIQRVAKTLCTEYATAWHRHTELRDALRPSSSPTLFDFWRLSWVCVCRLLLMMHQIDGMVSTREPYEEWPSDLFRIADDFPFVKIVGEMGTSPALSSSMIGHYSPRILMLSASGLCEALDTHGWTPSGGAYMQALFLRYASIVHDPIAYADKSDRDAGGWEARVHASADEEADEEAASNAGSAAGAPDPASYVTEPLLAPARLTSAFLDTGERLFFHHIWRDQSLRSYWQIGVVDRQHVPWSPALNTHRERAEWRMAVGLPAFQQALVGMLKDPIMRETIVATLQNTYPSRLPWPGERDQMRFVYSAETRNADAHELLYRMRYDGYRHMQETLHFETPGAYVDEYVTRQHALSKYFVAPGSLDKDVIMASGRAKRVIVSDLDWLETNVLVARGSDDNSGDTERVLLLLFEICVNLVARADSNGGDVALFSDNAYVDDRTLDKGRARPPPTREGLCARAQTTALPTFVACWQNYVVCGKRQPQGMAEAIVTGHLIDALAIWLRLMLATPRMQHNLNRSALCQPPWRDLAMPVGLF